MIDSASRQVAVDSGSSSGKRADSGKTRKRSGRGKLGQASRSLLRWIAASLLGLLVLGAPSACGAVHRPAIMAVLGVTALLAIATAVLGWRGRAELKPGVTLIVPLLFLLLAVVQIVPIPWGLRERIDPAGSLLLGLANMRGAQPLSLDSPATALEAAKAAAALAVALAALVLSSDRKFRFVAVGLVACGGLVALAIGLGHRAIFEIKIYGMFSSSRGLPNGPFINSNHMAEFLELAAFASLAFSFSCSSRDGQRVWKVIAAVLAAGALSTLSRGSVLALGAGVLTWFLLAPKSDDGEPLHRTRFAAGLIAVVVVTGIALGFGAEDLLARFSQNGTGREPRIEMWWNALKILPTHPAGIGLGAFARVFPVYRTFPSKVWFQYPENQPLGFLLEAGIPGTAFMLGACILVLRHFFRNARRDRIEASLAAGLVAVLAHNLTDFGLETLGVLLPFCAVAGSVFGRQANVLDTPVRRPVTTVFAAGSLVGVLGALALLLSPAARDFDEFLKVPITPDTRAAIHSASVIHPTDYLYALAEARSCSTTPTVAGSRLQMLNRAMWLCPTCPEAHAETARFLWSLGRRPQALIEWRAALGLAPDQLEFVFTELVRSGAHAEELASLANDGNRYELNHRLLVSGMIEAARVVLANATDREDVNFQLAQAKVALAANDLGAAMSASEAALAVAPRDPRAVLLASEVELRHNRTNKALEILQVGLRAQPDDVELNRKLLSLLLPTEKWQAIEVAIAGLRNALTGAGQPATEANIAAAHVFERRGQFYRAIAEYQAALAQQPEDVPMRMALARAAEQSGRVVTAIDAYNAVLRRAPDNGEARAALERIQRDKRLLELFGGHPPQTGVNRPR
jgi:tetratricopeptide (TPR) repeat protein/O-antigen ligase